MNTINDTQIATKELWKKIAQSKSILPADVAAYAIIRAIRSRSNEKIEVAKGLLLKSFTPIVNQRKLAKGVNPWQSLESAVCYAVWSRITDSLTEEERSVFRQIATTLAKEKWNDETYAYIIVRRDLPKIQQVVQAAHVTMVLGQLTPKKQHDATRQNFCIFGADNESELAEIRSRLLENGIKIAEFYEPDIGNQLTAIATEPLRKSIATRRRLFPTSKLLTID